MDRSFNFRFLTLLSVSDYVNFYSIFHGICHSFEERRTVGNAVIQIYSNFKLWPYNYIAYDLLMQEHRFKHKYTIAEERKFEIMIEQAMIHIDFPITDIKERFLKLYAYPVINKLKAEEKKK